MPEVGVGLSTEARELGPLARRLRKAGGGRVLDETQSRFRTATVPVLADLRAAALRVQVTSTRGGRGSPPHSSGLRRTTASAIDYSPWTPTGATGVRLYTSAGKMRSAGYPGDLSKYLDASLGNYKRWAHPVFGSVTVWTVQRGSPWWFTTIERHVPRFRQAVADAIVAVRDYITS